MGGNTFVGQTWRNLTDPQNGSATQIINNSTGVPQKIHDSTPATPPPQPQPQSATTTQLQNQLSQEKTNYMTSAFLTSGQGLLDEPTTTSRILLGN